MPQPPSLEDRKPPITPQLAVRVAVLGGFAFVLFAIVFFRLWFLQVLSGDDFVVQARENRVRKTTIEAPRGEIVDRTGRVKLVESRESRVVILRPNELPPAGLPRRQLYHRLGRVLGMSGREVQAAVFEQRRQLPYADVRLKTDVEPEVYNYLKERSDQFPGVDTKNVYIRSYPKKTLAAHLWGTIRQISPTELEEDRFRGLEAGARIGDGGVEEIYDQYLRGIDGYERYVVTALGEEKADAPRRVKQPRQGRRLKLSLDYNLERAADKAMARAVSAAPGAEAGAYVAMNPYDGQVYALGSYPSYDANEFARPLTQKRYDELAKVGAKPLVNRAVAGVYPTGSTFKLITAVAALEEGFLSATERIFDDGLFEYGTGKYRNARNARFGSIDLTEAMKVSSDVFFYTLGARSNDHGGNKIQKWARLLGLGKPTGIDLPGEFAGLVPDRRWRERGYRVYERCVKREKVPIRTLAAVEACGGIERPWVGGDNINLSVGQGDFQATPLQMAVSYAALFNGGYIVRPRVGLAIEDSRGIELQRIPEPPRRKIPLSESTRAVLMEGLRKAAMEEGGTSYAVFKGFGETVYGKTGTVERFPNPDQSWYVAGTNLEDRERAIVVAVTIEKGGFGAETAAPAARLILSKWLDKRAVFQAGTVE